MANAQFTIPSFAIQHSTFNGYTLALILRSHPTAPAQDELTVFRPHPLLRHLLGGVAEAFEEGAHVVPLRVGQDGAHVDEHHQLAVEEAAAGFAEAGGEGADLLAVELRLIE